MDGYDTTPSRNQSRAVGGNMKDDGLTSSAEIPGKVNEPEGKDTTGTKSSGSAGSGTSGFSGGGLINPFISGTALGGTDTADDDDKPSV